MAEPSTFIKLFRNIRDWRWYTDANTMRVFIELLLTANIKDNDFMNVQVKRGETVTSLKKIANNLDLSMQEVRTAIDHLKATNEITCRRHSKFSVISIINYERYQGSSTNTSTSSSTIKQQSNNNQSTINQQQLKNIKNIRKKEYNNKGGSAASLSGFSVEGFAEFLSVEDD